MAWVTSDVRWLKVIVTTAPAITCEGQKSRIFLSIISAFRASSICVYTFLSKNATGTAYL